MKEERQKTILLVEDEVIIAMAEKMTLEKYGYAVITANTGEQAVATVKKTPTVDLILMDINLGAGMDGTEAAAAILMEHDLPVVFLSSHMEPAVVAKTEKITSYGYVVKDSSGTVLDASIKMAFKLFEAKISARNKAEALRASEAKYHTLFHEMLDGFALHEIVCDRNGNPVDYRFLEVNPAFERMTGLQAAAIIGRTVLEVLPGTERHWIETYGRVAVTGEPAFFENYTAALQKHFMVTAFQPAPGQFACIFIDITERERAEKALRESEAKLDLALRSAGMGVWHWDIVADRRYFDEQVCRLLGLNPATFAGTASEFFAAVHPDDREAIQAALARVIDQDVPYEPEYRAVWPDGSIHYINARGRLSRDEEGRPLKINGIIWEVTGHKLVLEELNKSQMLLQSSIESPKDMIILSIDRQYRYLYFNTFHKDVMAKAYGKDVRLGMNLLECITNEADRIKAKINYDRALAGENHATIEEYGDLNRYYYETRYNPIINDRNEVIGATAFSANVTERTLAEDALKANEARARALLKTIPDMLFRVDRRGVFLDYRADVKDLYDQSGATLVGKSCRDVLPPEIAGLLEEKIRVALETGRLLTFGYPLPVPGRGVRDFEARMAASGPDEVTAIVRDVTEGAKAERLLRQSEERLRDILFSMADWVWEVDENGVYTYSSEKGSSLLGSSRADIIGKTPFDFMPPEEAARVGAIFSGIVAEKGIIKDLENWNIGRNGERICLLTNGMPILDEQGNLRGYRGVDKDITDRKRAEEVIHNTLRFQQELLDAVPTPIFYKDARRVYIGGNKAFELYIGRSREQIIGKTVHDIAPAELAEKYDRADRELLEKQGTQTYESSVIHADGTPHDVIFHKAVFTDGAGRVAGLIGVILDISERKRGEEAMRISEAKQANALQMTKAGNWEYDVDSDMFTFNDNFYRIFRTTAAAVGGYQMSSAEYARRFCHPDDAAQVGEETRAAMASADPDYSRQIEHRILYADGEIGWIAVRFFIVKDPQGRTIKTYGVNQDITERKRAEEEIKRQLAEKEILLKEVHHRIKNNIASIGGLLSLRLQSIRNPEAVAVLQDAIGRVDSMRILYDKLLLSKGYEDISVKNYVESLTEGIIALFQGRVKITVEKNIADFAMDPKLLFPLGLIINELLTNKMKYAFIGRDGGRIQISLTHTDNRVRLVLQDDGVGLPKGFDMEKTKGFGLMLVKMLSQQLGGNFSIETRNGTRSILEFPL